MSIFSRLKSLIPGRRKDEPIHSFVLLLESPRALDVETLQRIASRELGIEFPPDPGDDPEASWVIGQPPIFMVKIPNAMVIVNCFAVPYMKNPEKESRSIPELRRRKAVAEHAAWLSVDWMGDKDEDSLREGYSVIGKLAAGLAEGGCLAIYSPATNHLAPYEPELLEALRGEDPRSALEQASDPPVVPISDDDPRLKAAVEEARRRWPEFVAAYADRKPDQHFSVKAPISDGENTEFIWIEVAEIEGDCITGDLANEPVELRFMRLGSRVRTTLADLNDWAYIEDGELRGGFSLAALDSATSRR